MSVEAPKRPDAGIPTPEADMRDDEAIRIVLTSLDQNVDAFAREAAHERVAKKHEGPLWKRTVKSIWGNLTREYQLVKATQEARQEIRENENLLHHKGMSDEKWREAVVDRYGSEYAEHLIHEGETFHKLEEAEAAGNDNAGRIRKDTLDLMRQYAKGDIADDASLQMMQDQMIESWREEGISREFIGEGELLAHNIGDMARQIKAALDSTEGLSSVDREARLEEMLAKAEIVTGEARVGSRTEIDSTLSERISEKLQKVPFLNEGRIARVTATVGNEAVVAAMISAGAYLGRRGISTLGKIVAPGIGAGIVAAIRERRALRDERALHARRMDTGQEAMPGSKAQAEIDATMYESRSAGELLDGVAELYTDTGELKLVDRDDLDRALQLQAEIRARIEVSDRTGARLINFADISPEEMEGRRFDLDLAMAKLEVDMKRLMADPTAQATMGLSSEDTFDRLSADQKSIATGMLEGEMKAKDRLFAKLVAKRAFKRALAATMMGATIGGVFYTAKEIAENIQADDIELAGYEEDGDVPSGSIGTTASVPVDHIGTGVDAPTEYVGWKPSIPTDHVGSEGGSPAPTDHVGTGNHVPSDHIGTHTGVPSDHVGTGTSIPGESIGVPEGVDAGHGETYSLSETSKVTFPEGFKAEVDGKTITVTTPSGEKITGITLEKDGSLSSESKELLKSHGFNIFDHQEVIQGKPNISTSTVTPSEFVQNHQDQMKKIRITKWFDNNTSRYDLNELGLDNHLRSDGSILVSIKGMTSGGSFHGASGVNWHEAAKDGHMKIYLSASQGTQAQAFEVQIKPDGTAIIDNNSPARALFDNNGKFIGGYEQAALNGGQGADGRENIAVLATEVGKHAPKLTETITTPTYQPTHHYILGVPHQQTSSTTAATTTFAPPSTTFSTATTTRRQFGGPAEDEDSPAPPSPDTDTITATDDGTGPEVSAPSGQSGEGSDTSTGPENVPPGVLGGAESTAADTDVATGGPAAEVGAGTRDTDPDVAAASGPEAVTADADADEADHADNPDVSTADADTGAGSADTDSTAANPDADAATGPDTTGADSNPAPDADMSTADTGPAPDAATGPDTSEADAKAAEEQEFFADLDAEPLDTPYGYDFPGYAKMGARERKQAVRFIRAAMGELGDKDLVAVVARAAQLAQDALGVATGQTAQLYQDTLGVLRQSAERVERDANKDKGGEGYLKDLDSETGSFPFLYMRGADALSPRVQKLVTRVYRDLRTQLEAERGPAPGRDTDREGYLNWYKTLLRRGQAVTSPDRQGGLDPADRLLFEEAQKVFNQARSLYSS